MNCGARRPNKFRDESILQSKILTITSFVSPLPTKLTLCGDPVDFAKKHVVQKNTLVQDKGVERINGFIFC